MHACACVGMVENDQKHSKISKKVPLKCLKVTATKLALSLWQNFFIFSWFFLVFLRKPLVCLSCAWWKRNFFHNFQLFFVGFDHANACASMRSLVKIHNSWGLNLSFNWSSVLRFTKLCFQSSLVVKFSLEKCWPNSLYVTGEWVDVNGTTSVSKSVPCLVLDKVRLVHFCIQIRTIM